MRRVNRWVLLLGAGLAVFVFVLAGLWSPVTSAIRYITLPIIRAAAGVSGALVGTSMGPRAPEERLQELESRLAALTIDYVKLRALEEENRSLRAQAHFLTTSGFDSVGARVISRQIKEGESILTVDRGRQDHVEIGQAVITNEGVLIGKVSAMQERVATIQLLTDVRSRIAAAVAEDGKLVGVLEGRGNGATALTYIPSSQPLHRDQVIVTAGTEAKVPAHLPIGIVNAIEGTPSDPFVTAAIEPLVSIDRVVYVSILRPTAHNPSL